MSLELDVRQRAMLQDMGITVWLPKPAPAPAPLPQTAPVPAPLPQAAPVPAPRQKASPPAVALPPPASIRETLINSSGQAGFAVLDAVQGANRSRSGATARICNAAMHQNPQMAAARGIDQRFLSAPHQWHAPVALYSQADAKPEGGSCWLVLLESNTPQQPLSGDVGQLLDNMLRAMRLHRHPRVFAASLAASGTQALGQVLENAQPSIILALGRAAAHAALESTAPLGTLRQIPHRLASGMPVVVSYDPAYLLRALPETKAAAWADLCLALEIACTNATITG